MRRPRPPASSARSSIQTAGMSSRATGCANHGSGSGCPLRRHLHLLRRRRFADPRQPPSLAHRSRPGCLHAHESELATVPAVQRIHLRAHWAILFGPADRAQCYALSWWVTPGLKLFSILVSIHTAIGLPTSRRTARPPRKLGGADARRGRWPSDPILHPGGPVAVEALIRTAPIAGGEATLNPRDFARS